MKIPKAIEILEFSDTWPQEFNKDDLRDALKLGIEALIFYQTHKHRVIPPYDVLLPGEAPE